MIELCRQNPPKSLIRSYGLNLLINMSVLEHLHEEYMSQIHPLSFLIESTFEHEDETLSMGKLLVNLSKNRSNIENLLQLTVRIEMKQKKNKRIVCSGFRIEENSQLVFDQKRSIIKM